MMNGLHKRLAREDGFTLVELLVAMSVGTVVLMAAFMVLDRSVTLSNEVADRSDALQRGRQTMELLTRQLRSQVCLGEAKEPIVEGKRDTVTFYADLTDGSDASNMETRKLTYFPSDKTVVEERYAATGDYPDLIFDVAPYRRRVIGTKIKPVQVSGVDQPIFRYYGFKTTGPQGVLEELSTPLTTDSVARNVMIKVAFVSQTERTRPKDQEATTLENEVYVRSADPMQPEEGARCM